jgi:phosphoglycolate phosphatase-like HAD superfamily hydrolase
MNTKKVLFLFVLIFSFMLLNPVSSFAFDLQGSLISNDSVIVRIVEEIEYFLAFTPDRKVEVLEKHAERKLELAKKYANEGEQEKVQNMVGRYRQIRERVNKVVGKNIDANVLGTVKQRVLNQQTTMEEIKNMVEINVKNEIIEVQEKVVNDVAKHIVEVNGVEEQTEFFEEVEVVWAPGTGPGGEGRIVVEGGEMMFAPGTDKTSPSGADIQDVVVKENKMRNSDDSIDVIAD